MLAKVKVYPYQIQQSGILCSFEQKMPMVIASPAKAIAIPGNQYGVLSNRRIPYLTDRRELFSSVIGPHL